jgi:hypothetical protein
MDFDAEPYQKEDMDHDVLLTSPEGMAVVEIEGKDKDAIRVEKIDQLSRVVDEHFHEHDVYPEGVLIGNPYRLVNPDDREAPFTKKAQIAATRKGFGLLTTTELYKAVVRILENPETDDFKTACRTEILGAKGKEIIFPTS